MLRCKYIRATATELIRQTLAMNYDDFLSTISSLYAISYPWFKGHQDTELQGFTAMHLPDKTFPIFFVQVKLDMPES
jgi:hypothetical protein